ncbi:MAG: hypothetical protein JRI74_08045 [Deltaproteobacteria bacterium]|nr:hypothetical protein [Deltaproteobacteria bacterium]
MTGQGKAPTFEPSPEYLAREKRFNDAVSLKKPDRVPVASLAGFFMASYAGLNYAKALYDYEAMADAWKYSTAKLNLDMIMRPSIMFPGPVMELLGLKTFKWPGYNLDDTLTYQFVEKEYMLADEYDEMLSNPADFVIRKMMPRMSKTLEPLGLLPPIHWLSSGYTLISLASTFAGMPPITEMLQKLGELGKEMNKHNAVQSKLTLELASMGYPMVQGGVTFAPFDWVSDHFRGLRGTMLDMFRLPDKLKAAIDLFTPFAIESALMAAQRSGNPRVFIPLHRGAGSFMSNEQYGEFYWPSLKKLLLTLIDAGLTPMPFFEGDYTPRLEFLAELPPGKICGHFDIIDKKKAKEIIGDVMCFWGNVPAGLLVTGTPQQIKDYVKELIDIFGDNGGLIVDGAVDGVPPESKPENVEAMIETAFEYGVY